MSFKHVRLRTKIILGIGVPLVLAIILGIISITNINSMLDTGKWVEHTQNVIRRATAIIASAVDMETGMRGYLLAGKEDFLYPYQNGEQATYKQLKSLRQTVSDNPAQVKRLEAIEKTLREWQKNVTDPMIALRREIGDADSMNDVAALTKEARDKVYFDQFRGQIATFIAREEELMVERRQAAQKAATENEANATLLSETTAWVTHTQAVLARANQIMATAVDMETGMRGYLLAGQEEFLNPYKADQETFFALVASLSKTVADNPAQVKLLEEMSATIEEWQEQVTTPTIELRREIGDANTMNDMAVLIREARGKVYFDTFRGQIATFIEREDALLSERRQAAEEATAQNEANAELITEASAWVDHTHGVIATAHNILATAVDMETGMRGYLLAGQEEFLDPYQAGQTRFFELVASLSTAVDDNPAQVKLLGEIKATIEEWQDQVTKPAIALRREVGAGTGTTLDDVVALVGKAKGKVYFDTFRDQIATLLL